MFKNKNKGFTIIELIVVIAIIGVLAGIVAVNVSQYLKNARDARRKADISQIRAALEMYYADNVRYPNPSGLWKTSVDSSSWSVLQSLVQSYIKLPIDPINNGSAYPGNFGYYNYSYYYNSTILNLNTINECPIRQFYLLLFKLENPNMTSPGALNCDGTVYVNFSTQYPGTITVGGCASCP